MAEIIRAFSFEEVLISRRPAESYAGEKLCVSSYIFVDFSGR